MTASAASLVAVLGTRYADLSVEEEVLGPLGVQLVAGDGGSAAEVLAVARGAEVVLAGSRPRFDAEVVEAPAADGCRGIVRYGIGTDSIDLGRRRPRRHRRRPGVRLRHRGGGLPRRVDGHRAAPPAARGGRRRAPRGVGRRRPASAAPAVPADRRRRRLRPDRSPYGRQPARPGLPRGGPRRVRRSVPTGDGVRPVGARRAARAAATSSRCTRPATRRRARCSTPPGWRGCAPAACWSTPRAARWSTYPRWSTALAAGRPAAAALDVLPAGAAGRVGLRAGRRPRAADAAHGVVHRGVRARHAAQGRRGGRPPAARRAAARARRRPEVAAR